MSRFVRRTVSTDHASSSLPPGTRGYHLPSTTHQSHRLPLSTSHTCHLPLTTQSGTHAAVWGSPLSPQARSRSRQNRTAATPVWLTTDVQSALLRKPPTQAPCTVHRALCTVHRAPCTMHTVHRAPCTVHMHGPGPSDLLSDLLRDDYTSHPHSARSILPPMCMHIHCCPHTQPSVICVCGVYQY